jgi:Na+/H+ antiporter NhaC
MICPSTLPLAQLPAADAVAHPYGWLSLLPPLVAVAMAIATKRVYISLLVGIAVGALILSGGAPLVAAAQMADTHLWKTLISEDKLRLAAFTLSIGAIIGIVGASGGMSGLVALLAPLARGRRSGQLVVWGSGLLVFFDDYANTLLLGSTFRSTCDRLKISREKLAYLVDSTAAPVAGLAIISTWIAVEISYIEQGLQLANANPDVSAFNLFLSCIPYRFYVIQALLLVLIIAASGRDFGPMLAAERQNLARSERRNKRAADDNEMPHAHWVYAVLPIAATLSVVVALMLHSGCQPGTAEIPVGSLYWLRDTFGAADSGTSLQYGGLIGLAVAWVLCRATGKLAGDQFWNAAMAGVRAVLPAVIILWLAGTMSAMTGNKSLDGETATAFSAAEYRLYLGDYLKMLLQQMSESPELANWFRFLLPTIVFVTSGFVAFSTGTSFGTMGILLPIVVPLAHGTLGGEAAAFESDPLMLASVGSVLAGAIFGDHCSPISDTTILSSQASGCDHVAHVTTQLPYALLGAAVSILLGTLLLGFGINVWILLGLQTSALLAFVLLVGRQSET